MIESFCWNWFCNFSSFFSLELHFVIYVTIVSFCMYHIYCFVYYEQNMNCYFTNWTIITTKIFSPISLYIYFHWGYHVLLLMYIINTYHTVIFVLNITSIWIWQWNGQPQVILVNIVARIIVSHSNNVSNVTEHFITRPHKLAFIFQQENSGADRIYVFIDDVWCLGG